MQEGMYSLQEFKKELRKDCFGNDAEENLSKGLCIQCKELAIPKCYSEMGIREYEISGLCEKCFDQICGAEE
ncbi:MAG: hypothetical protein GY714_19915 [Desulfobacterales bacterium]|nr:hypothetical protein [Desulfobacterales bacterium]